MLLTQGAMHTLRHAGTRLLRPVRTRLTEFVYERRFGIRTRGKILMASLGISDPDAIWYEPTSYPGFFNAMRHVVAAGGFVDYGCGLGRVLVAAATFPFAHVTGVEHSPQLARGARANLARARRLVCRNISVVCTNAVDWRVPDDVTVFHFYNPFVQQTLRAVVKDIARSLHEAPRRAWIVFACPWGMEPLMRSGELIPPEWQLHSVDEVWPTHAVVPDDPEGNRYRVYALDSRRVVAPGTGR
jgi:SAM-dependent methyltransferase